MSDTATKARNKRARRTAHGALPCVGCGATPTTPVNGIDVCDRCAHTAAGRIITVPSVDDEAFDRAKVTAKVRRELAQASQPHSASIRPRAPRSRSRKS